MTLRAIQFMMPLASGKKSKFDMALLLSGSSNCPHSGTRSLQVDRAAHVAGPLTG
jgi:hypothetical protein